MSSSIISRAHRLPLRCTPSPLQSQTRTFRSSTTVLEARQQPQTPTQPPPGSTRPPRRGHKDQLPVLPLIALFFFGSGSFYYLAKSRDGQGSSHYVLPERAPPKEDWPRSKSQ